MKRLMSALLIFALLLSGCQMADSGPAAPDLPVITTPQRTPITLPEGVSLEITEELSRFYFDFCRDYDVGFLPSFNYHEGQRPDISDLERYACIVLSDELYWDGDIGTVAGDQVEKISRERFDFSIGLTAEDQVEYRSNIPGVASYNFIKYSDGKERYSASFCRLLEYRTTQSEGRTFYSVKVENYSAYHWLSPMSILNLKKGVLGAVEQAANGLMQAKGLSYFEAMKELTVTGRLAEMGNDTRTLEFTYMDNGMGAPVFLSFEILDE